MRRSLYPLALLLTAPVFAQEPDTTDWHHYLPLAVGNEWQYFNTGFGVPDWYTAFQITGDSLVDGQAYFVVERCTRHDFDPAPMCGEEPHLIRYEEDDAVVVERRVVDGTPTLELWPNLVYASYCRLDLPFDGFSMVDCFGGTQMLLKVIGEYGVSVGVGGDQTPEGTRKVFLTGFEEITFLSGIGLLEAVFEFAGPRIVFARVGGVEYGTRAIAVAAEDGARPEAPPLTVYPNPIRDIATLRFALAAPGHLTLAVYDVRGRRVRTLDLGPHGAGEGMVRFEAGDLPPGAYRLRLLGDDGFEAARGVIVLR